MNLDWLNNATKKELATRAKNLGIASFESMRKEELVKAITKALKKKEAAKQAAKETAGTAGKASSSAKPSASSAKPTPKPAPPKPAPAKPTPVKPVAGATPKPKPSASPSANGNGKHHSNGSHKPTASPAPKPAPTPKPVSSPMPSSINRPSITSSTVMGHASPVVHKPTLPGVPHGSSKPVSAPTKSVTPKEGTVNTPTTTEYYAKPPKYLPATASKDRLMVVVRDPFWLSISWELSTQSIQRAEAALAQDWHGARPILRVLDVSSQDTTSTAERIVKDVEIHGGTNHWYVDVNQPPRTYRIDLGYLSRRGTFHVLCRSNVINTPKAGVSEIVDTHWEDVDRKQADQIYSMSGGGTEIPRHDEKILQEFLEEKLRRPLAAPIPAPTLTGKDKKFFFNLHAELIIWGETAPGARVTFQGEPIRLRPDGTFAQRYQLPDGRQIFPAIAESPDNSEERKIVLAVERNTKVLEPLTQKDRDLEDDD